MHSSWFDVDQPCDDEDEVSQLETEHQHWVNIITLLWMNGKLLTTFFRLHQLNRKIQI